MYKTKILLPNYYNYYEDLPIYHTCISDNASGLLLTSRLVTANFSNCVVHFVKPSTAREDVIPGIYITPTDSANDTVSVIIFTLHKKLEVLSNDEYAARNILAKVIFKDTQTLTDISPQLTIIEEWTYSKPLKKVFNSAMELCGYPLIP